MKKSICLLPAAITLAALSPLALAVSPTIQLRIMETTDIHMHIANYDYYRDAESDSVGLSKVATLIKQARKEATNSVLVDNGDLIQGNPLGDFVAKGRVLRFGETHPAFKAMNLLDYDVGNVGNHEFNYGLDFLAKSLAGANFPYVSANVYADDGDNNPENDQPYFMPYVIKTETMTDTSGQPHDVKVGYIGFTPPQIMNWDKDNLTGLVTAKDIIASAEKYVPMMKAEGADIVIAIPHSGLYANPRTTNEEHAVYHLAKVEGIDAILFGHSHQVFPGGDLFNNMDGVDNEKGTVFGVPSVMPGFWGSHLGVIDLTLEMTDGEWQVASANTEVRAISKREGRETIALVEADKTINDAIKADHEGTLAYMRQKVGETTAPIYSYFSQIQDDPSVQIVNNAQVWYVENIVRGTEYDGLPIISAAAPFKAGGRGGADYYTDVPAGDIALKNVSDLYIYPNDLKVVKLNGAQVIDWLERSAGQFNQIDPNNKKDTQTLVNEAFPSYNFDVIDGIEYKIDVTQPSKFGAKGELENADARRILDVTYQGKAIDPAQEFLVVTNNYRAGGGGSFPALDGSATVIDAPDKNRDVIANYLLSQNEINPAADNNWSFADWGNARVTIRTSPKARTFAGDNLEFVAVEEDGFALFEFK
ncbi:bifunctional 2',3'-cyclic-nucleotide 2'-phosphodiesterase/3'-nucleotidase [Reinekea marinisedimentorum]|uniref:2',3'-cyclic-nucleotide 2'-phosphodiesterase/3'-nucleotidase n=1 Tax=Reinekea marinisedimentorum TaxID=230495 RepID=A0A4R3I3F1_9GAMM|nr:bifunctional 2',3'-cyclic-nucleotide 2'-phosphodiesterase/3'-nucleotidase [Reinekea marinisedimentorum]TCS40345.1 2',3'-cyclic-nucleotide 2'-phosphodiesterase/3'-nucleotidase [Reinekea marinisedimentorum]